MSRHYSSDSDSKKYNNIFLKIPRGAVKKLECLMKNLDRQMADVYNETNRDPILAYRIFIRVMNNFSNRTNRINDYVLYSLGLTETMKNRQQFPFQMAPLPQPIPQPPTITPPLLPPVAPPPRPPAVPLPGLLQVTAIRNIIQRAAREIRRLSRELLFLFGFVESLDVSGETKESLELFIESIYYAKIEEVRARATEDILSVLTGI